MADKKDGKAPASARPTPTMLLDHARESEIERLVDQLEQARRGSDSWAEITPALAARVKAAIDTVEISINTPDSRSTPTGRAWNDRPWVLFCTFAFLLGFAAYAALDHVDWSWLKAASVSTKQVEQPAPKADKTPTVPEKAPATKDEPAPTPKTEPPAKKETGEVKEPEIDGKTPAAVTPPEEEGFPPVVPIRDDEPLIGPPGSRCGRGVVFDDHTCYDVDIGARYYAEACLSEVCQRSFAALKAETEAELYPPSPPAAGKPIMLAGWRRKNPCEHWPGLKLNPANGRCEQTVDRANADPKVLNEYDRPGTNDCKPGQVQPLVVKLPGGGTRTYKMRCRNDEEMR